MIRRLLPIGPLVVLAALLPCGPAVRADAFGDLEAAVEGAAGDLVRAAGAVALDDRLLVLARLDRAVAAAAEAGDLAGEAAIPGRRGRRVGRRLARFRARLDRARGTAADPDRSARRTVRDFRRAARAGELLRREIRGFAVVGFALKERPGRRAGFHRPGRTVVLEIVPSPLLDDGGPCGEIPVVSVVNEGPGAALEEGWEDLGAGRIGLALGPGPGVGRVTVTWCGVTEVHRVFNRGPRGALGGDPGWGDSGEAPATLAYPGEGLSWRAGVPLAPFAPVLTGGAAEEFSVAPPLPAGVLLDPATGVLSGTPEGEAPGATYAVTARNPHGSVATDLEIEVTPPLPPEVLELEDGFAIEPLLGGLAVPSKMALAPDGRLFFNELATGSVRVVTAEGTLLPDPFATVAVQTGGERGLLGIAFAPDFGTSGHVFVYAVVPAAGPGPARGQVIRFTASGNRGLDPAVIVDDLPAGIVQNGGDLQFGPDGMLHVSVGDTGDPALAQQDGSRAGRILRFAPDGSVPSDNPIPGDPEWCRGLRNSFDMAFHPGTGGLFASENGPTFGDELNFIQKGKNYGWESLPPEFPGPLVGIRVAEWTPVIVPTGIAFHDGTGFGPEYADDLFLCGYDGADLRRLVLSGPSLVDLDEERPFARWRDEGIDHKPLDVVRGPDGALYVSTFTAIWRIRRYE